MAAGNVDAVARQRADDRTGSDLRAVGKPDRQRARVGIAPQDVDLAVAVEVADPLHHEIAGHGAEPLELVTWPLCTPHSAMSPALSRHNISPLASPRMVQVLGSAPKTAVEATVAPFMNQTATVPVVLSRHNRSPLPSPLRSPVPGRSHADGGVHRDDEGGDEPRRDFVERPPLAEVVDDLR